MHEEPIRKIRIDAGLSLTDASKEFSVSKRTIIRWERGTPRIPVDRLDDAKRILGVEKRDIRPDIFEGA